MSRVSAVILQCLLCKLEQAHCTAKRPVPDCPARLILTTAPAEDPSMGWARYAHSMRVFVFNSGLFYLR